MGVVNCDCGSFSRRRASPDTPPDGAFPFWSQSVADEFRRLVRQAFADVGSEVVMYADHVVDGSGTRFGLANLAASCHDNDGATRAWPAIINRHVARIISSVRQPNDFASSTDPEILARTYCRVTPADALTSNMTYGLEIAPGLMRVFNLDYPETVRYFTDDKVAVYGIPALVEAGTRNLRTVRVDAHKTLKKAGGRIEVLMSESVFTASLILILDEVVARYGHRIDPEVGAFVAIPNRNQLDYHIPRDTSFLPSLQLLAGFSAAGYRNAPGQVSPNVFWWRPGHIEQVSRVTDDHKVMIEIGPELAEVLNGLAEA